MGYIIPNHPDYLRFKPRWQKVRDVLEGGSRLKEVDLQSFGTYLRHIQPLDASLYNSKRNESYIKGANLYNATDRTLAGYLGMVFRIPPKLPDDMGELGYLVEDADGKGTGLVQHIKETVSNVIQVGREGILVDMPTRLDTGREARKADIKPGFRVHLHKYRAENIVDWNTAIIDGYPQVDLIILEEVVTRYINDGGLERENFTQYRVLRLNGGVYTQEVLDEGGDVINPENSPLNGQGVPLNYIPFVCTGSINNTLEIDKIPIESLVDINLGHYQNVADLESSSFQFSAGQAWIADDRYLNMASNPINKGEKVIKFGEASPVVLGTGGSFNIAQPSPNTLANDLRQSKEEQMVALGAQLISEGGQAETAEAARIKKASDASMLAMIVGNSSEAYTTLLSIAAEFINVPVSDDAIVINSNFFESKVTPEERKQIVLEWQSGAYPHRVALEQLQKGGVISEDEILEDLIAESDNEIKPGVELDGKNA